MKLSLLETRPQLKEVAVAFPLAVIIEDLLLRKRFAVCLWEPKYQKAVDVSGFLNGYHVWQSKIDCDISDFCFSVHLELFFPLRS